MTNRTVYIITLLISLYLLTASGTQPEVTPLIEEPVIRELPTTPPVTPEVTPEATPEINTSIPEEQFNTLIKFLGRDSTNQVPYNSNPALPYEEQYTCAHYTRDLIDNASKAGITMYALHLKGQNKPGPLYWHMVVLTPADGSWYVVEPQSDEIFNIKYISDIYGFNYAYVGKQVSITRNYAFITDSVRYLPGLLDGDYIYLEALK